MPAILEVSKMNTEFLAFFACARIILVGAAPNFKEKTEGKVHTAGAILCIAGSQAWALFVWMAYDKCTNNWLILYHILLIVVNFIVKHKISNAHNDRIAPI